MRINLIAIGQRMPHWIDTGFQEYAKRLPRETALHLIEIPASKRLSSSNINRLLAEEGQRMLQVIPDQHHVIALCVNGESWDTQQLAAQLQDWRELGQNISLLIGGPEGLAPACLQRANQRWSLSNLTLPHPLVRIIVAEQLYRAHTILTHHPYHR